MSEKVFEAAYNAVDVKLTKQRQGSYLYVDAHRDGERIGLATLHPAIPAEYAGAFESGNTITEWAYTHYHAAGDRTKVSHRLTFEVFDVGELTVRHEKKKEHLDGGTDREEHDWKTVETWEFKA